MDELRKAIRNRLKELTDHYNAANGGTVYFTSLNLAESEVRDAVNRLVTSEYKNLFELHCK
jgi:hypothetical protein